MGENAMRNKKQLLLIAAALILGACNNAEEKPAPVATILDATVGSLYGTVSDFSLDLKGQYKPGEELKFKVTPGEDFSIRAVTVNNEAATPVEGEEGFYKYTLKEGQNRVMATYDVDKNKDFVDAFKLNIPDEVFTKVMLDAPTNASAADRESKYYDFRRDGIEQVNLKGFINYVDGDTTHVETVNYGYTVKIRYLGIDTPESTSEIEEWGKSASNYNKSLWSNAKKAILVSQGWARGDEEKAATADGNQRSLAYVWYTTKDNPTKSDFRCLNLEMVYQGFSQGVGSVSDMGKEYYLAFDKANMSAEVNKRHQYSGEVDPNYYYGTPIEITMKELYMDGGVKSHYVDQKTLYRIHGYVSRKIGGAFYFQDKPSYTQSGTDLPEAYGLYVFSYAQTDIAVGDEVSVIGALSEYSGNVQLQGISYNTINVDPNRDTQIITSGNEIKPIEMSAAQFDSKKSYDSVLVKFTETLYAYNKTSTYNGETQDSGEGGIWEVNKYNEHYPFYNTSNKLIFFAHAGSESGKEIRLTQDQDILISYRTETSYSYKFWTGGTVNYNPKGAEYVYPTLSQDEAIAAKLITKEYKAKMFDFTGICQNYVSSSGKTQQYQLAIVAPGDITIKGVINK